MIEYAGYNDKDKLKKIWLECFDDSKKFTDWHFENNFNPENSLVWRENDEIGASLYMRPYMMNFRNAKISVGYLSGVATLPKYRNRGISSKTVQKSINEMAEGGAVIGLLIPAVRSIYERNGFRLCREEKKIRLCGDKLQKLEPCTDIDKISSIYDRAMNHNDDWILRSDKTWELILDDLKKNTGGECFVSDNAYALCDLRSKKIYEYITLDEKSETDGKDGEYMLCLPPVMARILDVGCVLGILSEDFDSDVSIKICDDIIEKNNDVFRVQKNCVTRGGSADFVMDISSLTKFAMAEKRGITFDGLFPNIKSYYNILF